ncbi:hypothetical protein G5714_005068 [Onychostoma macrolepis]|uniref:Uncharacterized protein n=1 Tax=Onychostoma macrolepis TaxID=369639 RepID=A0A7J6D744_9TELE|nr:hypothetical protein G5714_005068 [Onychostoma macrolepis]
MSLTASKKDWAHSPEEYSEVEGHAAFQDELIQIITKAVSVLGLECESPDEPAKSNLDDRGEHALPSVRLLSKTNNISSGGHSTGIPLLWVHLHSYRRDLAGIKPATSEPVKQHSYLIIIGECVYLLTHHGFHIVVWYLSDFVG